MGWEAVGAIGETLGALGVIVTLVYLAFQLRQNTRALRLNAEFSAAQEHVQNSIAVSATDVPHIVLRGLDDPAQLDEKEGAQFLFWMNGSMRMYQHQHQMFLADNLSRDSWSATEQLIKAIINSKGWQGYWQVRRATYAEPFQAFIDGLDTTGVVASTDVVARIRGTIAAGNPSSPSD